MTIRSSRRSLARVAAAIAVVAGGTAGAAAEGRILIINSDLPGVGLNDPTPAAPVGGNPATTLGEQRRNVLDRAADIWAAALRPAVDVEVMARMLPLAPTVSGQARSMVIVREFPGADFAGTWYPSALANHLSGFDHWTCTPPTPLCHDIDAVFSTTVSFYLGLDHDEGAGQTDLLAVAVHELGHGLGFQEFVDERTGRLPAGYPDIFARYTRDAGSGLLWSEMTDAQRIASAVNVRGVVWNGINVRKALPAVLQPGEPAVTVLVPASLGTLRLGAATFGAPLLSPGVTGDVAPATYAGAAGELGTDGCQPITSDVQGKIALVDGGTCASTTKVRHAQDAGALAVLVADVVAQSPPPDLTGEDASITIPAGLITLGDGNALKAGLADGVRVTLGLDLSVLAGADRVRGDMMLAAFDPLVPGQSISHFDAVARPNQLMEARGPADDAAAASLGAPGDLTLALMTDIGWFTDRDGVPDGEDDCIGSDLRPTVVLGRCESGVANPVVRQGCTVADHLRSCSAEENPGHYRRCVRAAADALVAAGLLTEPEKREILRCAAGD